MRRERGASLVEMALLLPFLVLLALGATDLSRIIISKVAVQDAAQEGVSYASFNPSDPGGAQQRAVEASTGGWFATGDVDVTCPAAGRITVTVNASVTVITPVLAQITGGTIDLTDDKTATVLSTTETCTPSP